jgi:hypothetical protein
MKKMMIADLIKASEIPEPGDPEDAGIENIIDLSPIGVATYKHNPEHDVYVVTLTLNKGGEVREYVLTPEGLKDLIDLGTRYFYQEMEDYTFDMRVMTKANTVDSEEEIYQTNYNNALEEYTRDPFTVTGTSVTNWGTKETATKETVIPELDEESLGTYEDILNNDINDNPSYTFEIFGYSYEIDLETLEGWINDPKMSYYNANIRVKPDPF